MILDYLMLPLIAYVGLRTSWEDLRHGKIRNRHILLLAGGALVFHVFAGIYWGLGYELRSFAMDTLGVGSLCMHTAINVVLSLLVSFLLWVLGIWAAGDAKLFSALAFALPLGFYHSDFLYYFPAFVLFFNTFIGILAWLIIEFVGRITWQAIKGQIDWDIRPVLAEALGKLRADWWKYVRLTVGLIAMFLAIRVLRKIIRWGIGEVIELNKTLMYTVLFVAFQPLTRFFQHRYTFYGALAVLAGYSVWAFGFAADTHQEGGALAWIGIFAMGIIVLYALYHLYTTHCDVSSIPVAQVKPGHILSDRFHASLTKNSSYNNERMGTVGPDGLTPQQVETLQTWYDKNDPDGCDAQAEICTTIPFAPGMMIGVILTIVLGGYVFSV